MVNREVIEPRKLYKAEVDTLTKVANNNTQTRA